MLSVKDAVDKVTATGCDFFTRNKSLNIETAIIGDGYFITSEFNGLVTSYSVRQFIFNFSSVATWGSPHGYASKEEARKLLLILARVKQETLF